MLAAQAAKSAAKDVNANSKADNILVDRFARVFEENLWGDNESASGPGSRKNLNSVEMAISALKVVKKIINFKSVHDIPCGDFNWMSAFLDYAPDVNYRGFDIVPTLIEKNQRLYPKYAFSALDITSKSPPPADLIFSKDFFNHLTYVDIKNALLNMKKSNSGYILSTNNFGFTNAELHETNPGASRYLDLCVEPFNLPPPIWKADNYLGLWRLSDIKLSSGKIDDFAKLEAIIARRVLEQVEAVVNRVLIAKQSQVYSPNKVVAGTCGGDYMAASNALARDFLHPEYQNFCLIYNEPLYLHRKWWEWAFIFDRLSKAACSPWDARAGVRSGRRETAVLFAKLGASITATDAPSGMNWTNISDGSDYKHWLFKSDIIDQEAFDDRVSFEYCDMNHISTHLTDYDFCWSSCCFEHLGSLQHGIDFVINSVERPLKSAALHATRRSLISPLMTRRSKPVLLFSIGKWTWNGSAGCLKNAAIG